MNGNSPRPHQNARPQLSKYDSHGLQHYLPKEVIYITSSSQTLSVSLSSNTTTSFLCLTTLPLTIHISPVEVCTALYEVPFSLQVFMHLPVSTWTLASGVPVAITIDNKVAIIVFIIKPLFLLRADEPPRAFSLTYIQILPHNCAVVKTFYERRKEHTFAELMFRTSKNVCSFGKRTFVLCQFLPKQKISELVNTGKFTPTNTRSRTLVRRR